MIKKKEEKKLTRDQAEKKIINLRSRLNGIYVKHSGKKIAEIEALMDRDTFLSPEDALKIGLIDEVVEKRPNVK